MELRHTGITRRLLAGDSIDDIADDAGNTPQVIRKHYRGVIDGMERSGRTRRTRPAGLAGGLSSLADDDLSLEDTEQMLAGLDDDQLEVVSRRIRAVRGPGR